MPTAPMSATTPTTPTTPSYSSEQQAAVQELLRRKATLHPDRAAAVDELAKRMRIGQSQGAGTGAGAGGGYGFGAGTQSDLPPGYSEDDLANPGPSTIGGVLNQNLNSFNERVTGMVKGAGAVAKNTIKGALGFGSRPPLFATPDEYRVWHYENEKYHRDNPDIVDMLVDPAKEQAKLAGEAAQQGSVKGVLGRSLAAAVPGAGPFVAQTYDDAQRGDVGAVLGNLAGATAPELSRRMKAPVVPGEGELNPKPTSTSGSSLPVRESPYGGPAVEPDLSRIPSTRTRIRSRVLNSSLARGGAKPVINEAIAAGKDPGLVYNENFPQGHVRPDMRQAAVDARLEEIHSAAQRYLTTTPEISNIKVSGNDVMKALVEPLDQANQAAREGGILSGKDVENGGLSLEAAQDSIRKMITKKFGSADLTPAQLNELTRDIYHKIKQFKPLSSADQSTTNVWQRQASNLRNLTESATTLPDGSNPLRKLNHDYSSLAAVSEAAGKSVAEGQTAPLMPRSVLMAGAAGGVGHLLGHPILAALAGGVAGGVYDLMNSPAVAAKAGRLLRKIVPASERSGVVRPPSRMAYELAPESQGQPVLPATQIPYRQTPIPSGEAGGSALFDPRTGVTGQVTPDLTPSQVDWSPIPGLSNIEDLPASPSAHEFNRPTGMPTTSSPVRIPSRGPIAIAGREQAPGFVMRDPRTGPQNSFPSRGTTASISTTPHGPITTPAPVPPRGLLAGGTPIGEPTPTPTPTPLNRNIVHLSPDELRAMEIEHRRQIAEEEAQMESGRKARGAPPLERHGERLSKPAGRVTPTEKLLDNVPSSGKLTLPERSSMPERPQLTVPVRGMVVPKTTPKPSIPKAPAPAVPVVPENPLFANKPKSGASASPLVERAVVDDRVRKMTEAERANKPEIKKPISDRAKATISGMEGSAARLRREADAKRAANKALGTQTTTSSGEPATVKHVVTNKSGDTMHIVRKKDGSTTVVKANEPTSEQPEITEADVRATKPIASRSTISPSNAQGAQGVKEGVRISWTGPQGVKRTGVVLRDGGYDTISNQRTWEVKPDHDPKITISVKAKNVISTQP